MRAAPRRLRLMSTVLPERAGACSDRCSMRRRPNLLLPRPTYPSAHTHAHARPGPAAEREAEEARLRLRAQHRQLAKQRQKAMLPAAARRPPAPGGNKGRALLQNAQRLAADKVSPRQAQHAAGVAEDRQCLFSTDIRSFVHCIELPARGSPGLRAPAGIPCLTTCVLSIDSVPLAGSQELRTQLCPGHSRRRHCLLR